MRLACSPVKVMKHSAGTALHSYSGLKSTTNNVPAWSIQQAVCCQARSRHEANCFTTVTSFMLVSCMAYSSTLKCCQAFTRLFTTVALQPGVGPWQLFQVLDPKVSRSPCTGDQPITRQDNTNTEQTHTDIHAPLFAWISFGLVRSCGWLHQTIWCHIPLHAVLTFQYK